MAVEAMSGASLGARDTQRPGRAGAIARLAGRLRTRTLELCVLAALFVLGAAPALYLGLHDVGVYNSPDETSRHLTARAFAETGRMAIEDEVSRLDLEGPAGPRGFVGHEGMIKTIYPLGFPFLIGGLHAAVGDAAVIVLALVPGCLMLVLGLIVRRLLPTAEPHVLLIVPCALPLMFWSSFVYMDVGLAWTCTAAGLLCWLVAWQGDRLSWLAGASALLALAALMRHQEAPFLLLLALVLILATVLRSPRDHRRTATVLLGYGLPQILVFLVPMALLNWATYGAPGTFGNTLFYRELFPERLPQESGAIQAALKFLGLAFFPQPISAETVWRGLFFQIFLLSPPLFVLGVHGIWISRHRLKGTLGLAGSLFLLGTLVYVLVSRADPGTVGAGASAPDLRASLTRYYWPIFGALAFGAAASLAAMPSGLSRIIVAGMLAVAIHTLGFSPTHSLVAHQTFVRDSQARYAAMLEEATEPDAVVFTGNIDKWIVRTRRTIAFWQEGGEVYEARSMLDPARLAADAAAIAAIGRPVYFLFRAGHGEDVRELRGPLAAHDLDVEWIGRPGRDLDLWKLEPVADGARAERVSADLIRLSWPDFAPQAVAWRVERKRGHGGTWQTLAAAQGARAVSITDASSEPLPSFYRIAALAADGQVLAQIEARPHRGPLALDLAALAQAPLAITLAGDLRAPSFWINEDGSSSNPVANPSFETGSAGDGDGLAGWQGGSATGGSVAVVADRAAPAGGSVMRMELAPSDQVAHLRRTFTLPTAGLHASDWTARVRVRIGYLHKATADLRLIGKDQEGAQILFASARADALDSDGFVPLAIEPTRLPADTAWIELQLGLRTLEEGGQGLVFWDGVELRPGGSDERYLDGDRQGARWLGAAHASASLLPAPDHDLEITLIPQEKGLEPVSARLAGPFERGDRVRFRDGTILLERAGQGNVATVPLAPARDGDRLSIRALPPAGRPGLRLSHDGAVP